jgi:hypothetical protein
VPGATVLLVFNSTGLALSAAILALRPWARRRAQGHSVVTRGRVDHCARAPFASNDFRYSISAVI